MEDILLKLHDVNEKCKAYQEKNEKEEVDDESAGVAYTLVNNMEVDNLADACLFCASMNLLNTYTKQENVSLGYSFKQKINRLINALSLCEFTGWQFDYEKSGRLAIFQIGDLQFSFHGINETDELKELIASLKLRNQSLEWDGIRKQKCAMTVFLDVIGMKKSLSWKGKKNTDMNFWIDKMRNEIKTGEMDFHKKRKNNRNESSQISLASMDMLHDLQIKFESKRL